MNKIVAQISVGELLDKISILEIKKEKIKDKVKLEFIIDEHEILKHAKTNNEMGNSWIQTPSDINALCLASRSLLHCSLSHCGLVHSSFQHFFRNVNSDYFCVFYFVNNIH